MYQNVADKDLQIFDAHLHTSEQDFRCLSAPWTGHSLAHIANTVMALCPETCRCPSLYQQCPNALFYWAVHPSYPSISLRHEQSGGLNLNTAHHKILQALDVFSFPIPYTFLNHASELSLDPTDLTLQQLTLFAILLYCKRLHMTRRFIGEGNKVPCFTY